MRDLECPFCNMENERIIYESGNFFVTPTLGSFLEGYLLICTNRHFIGLSQIPEELFQELDELKEKVKKALSDVYTSPIFFEHGVIDETKRGGCCVDHAHLHAVPIDFDIFPDIVRNFEARRIERILELRKQQEKGRPYFYYENQKGDKYVFELSGPVPPQYLRQIVAVRAGLGMRWDWRESPEFENFNKTLEKLRRRF